MRRYDAYVSALKVLETAKDQDLTNQFVQGGIVDKFALQFELGWKMLKDLLRYEGYTEASSGSPRDVLKAAYRFLGFLDEETWLAMLKDRNSIMHVYDADELEGLLQRTLTTYIPSFVKLREDVEGRYGSELEAIA